MSKGFSLIETLVATTLLTAITVIVATTGWRALEQSTNLRARQVAASQLAQTVYRVNQAVRVAVNFPPAYTDPRGIVYTSDNQTLIMSLASLVDGQASPLYRDTVIYRFADNQVREIVFADSHSSRVSHDQIAMAAIAASFSQTKDSPMAHRRVVLGLTQNLNRGGSTIFITANQTMVARND